MSKGNKLAWLNSLTVKVFIGFWLIAISVMAITRVVSNQFIDDMRVEVINENEQLRIKKIITRVERTLSRNKHNSIKKQIRSSHHLPPGIWLKALPSGEVFTNTPNDKNDIKDYINEFKFTQPVTVMYRDYKFLGPFKINIAREDQVPTEYLLFLSKPLSRKDFARAFGRLPFALRWFTALAVTGLLSWLMSWFLINPINKLTQASNKFGQGDLGVRLPEFNKRNDEVGQLGQAFNNMADKLQDSIAAQQRLLGDISHELRSPLTRLQLALSLAKNVKDNNPDVDKYFARFDLEIQRLDKMIGQALQLSRLENQLQSMHSGAFNLSALLTNIISNADLLCQQKQLHLKADITENIVFNGDAELISSAIENIINNAIRYSPNNGEINISLQQKQQSITVEITDQGPGVEAEYIDKIFTPFYRTAQARDRVSGGTGLGLAIALNAINCHKGHIYAKLVNPQATQPGLSVTIELPADHI